MKKSILAGLICLSLLMVPVNAVRAEAAAAPQGQTQFVYYGTSKTEIDRGPGITAGGSAKTGDTTKIGNWLMALSGSALILFLIEAVRRKEKEDEEISQV